jgi:hypothetical protein
MVFRLALVLVDIQRRDLQMSNSNLNNVFVAAKAQGKSTQVVVSAIKACINGNWDDAINVANVANAYKAGRLCASLELKDEKAALAILALKPFKDDKPNGDNMRTLGQHMACRAAISAWSNIRLLAGFVSAQTGQKRKPKVSTANKPDATTLPDNLEPAIVRALSVADVHAYALRMAGNIARYQKLNAALCEGTVGDLLRNIPVSLRKAIKADQGKVTTGEPVTPKVALAA